MTEEQIIAALDRHWAKRAEAKRQVAAIEASRPLYAVDAAGGFFCVTGEVHGLLRILRDETQSRDVYDRCVAIVGPRAEGAP